MADAQARITAAPLIVGDLVVAGVAVPTTVFADSWPRTDPQFGRVCWTCADAAFESHEIFR